ncbi:MAG: hypothetical protein U9N40_01150 [Euryarchaeota archaeon]|nr:hypothetical protein [Euryarchaeota archaeon]
MKIESQTELLREKIIEDDFLEGRDPGNEIPFWIFDHPSENELLIRERYNGAFCYAVYEDIGQGGKPISFPPFNERNKAAGFRDAVGNFKASAEIQKES